MNFVGKEWLLGEVGWRQFELQKNWVVLVVVIIIIVILVWLVLVVVITIAVA